MAILDADKEGFLRSTRSLIQTIGRAARNLHGKAILYADYETASMATALKETARRRQKQEDYNRANGITPRGVEKKIRDIIDGVYAKNSQAPGRSTARGSRKSAVETTPRNLTPEQVKKKIVSLEKSMQRYARDLEFEQAAQVRDEISDLKQSYFGAG